MFNKCIHLTLDIGHSRTFFSLWEEPGLAYIIQTDHMPTTALVSVSRILKVVHTAPYVCTAIFKGSFLTKLKEQVDKVDTLMKLDNLIGAIYFWQHGTRPPLPPHGLPSPPTVYRHHGHQSLLL